MLNESSWVPTPKPRFQSLAALPITLSSFTAAITDVNFPAKKLQPENVPVLRRRKYTRQQRKSLIIEPDTSLILAGGIINRQTSSSDEDQKQSEVENAERRIGGAKRRIRIKKRFHSTSNLKGVDDENGEKITAATASTTTTKSLSVRDLNGDNIDFNNRDSVKKWTSQIFAELDSIPNSRRGSMDANLLVPPQLLVDFKPLEPAPLPPTSSEPAVSVGPNFLRDLLLTATYSTANQYPESNCSSSVADRLAVSDTGTQKEVSRASSSFEWLNQAVSMDRRPSSKYPNDNDVNDDGSSDEADREVALIAMSTHENVAEQRKKNYDDLEKSVHELESLGNSSWFSTISDADTNRTLPASFRQRNADKIESVYDNSILLPELLKLSKSTAKTAIAKSGTFAAASGSSHKSIRIDDDDDDVVMRREQHTEQPFSLHNLPAVQRLTEFNSAGLINSNNKTKREETKPLVGRKTNSTSAYSDFAIQLAERDAVNACTWLRKSGFSKYADQFEEGKLPIKLPDNILDTSASSSSAASSLSRRISVLNRCHAMKVDSVPLRRAAHRMNNNNEFPRMPIDSAKNNDDNLGYSSESWSHRSPHNYHHLDTWTTPRTGTASSHHNKDHVYSGSLARRRSPPHHQNPSSPAHFPMAETSRSTTESRKVLRTDWYEARGGGTGGANDSTLDNASTAACVNEMSSNNNAKLQRSQSERIKDRARAIMKKMDLRNNSKRPKEATRPRAAAPPMSIGDPVLLLSYDTPKNSIRSHHHIIDRPSILPDRVERERGRQLYASNGAAQNRSKSIAQNRRAGLVFMSPTSPDSPPFGLLAEQPPRRRELSMPPTSRHRLHHNTNNNMSNINAPAPPTMFDVAGTFARRRELMPFDSYLYPGHISSLLTDRSPPTPSSGLTQHASDCGYSGFESGGSKHPSMFNDGYYTHEIKTTLPRHANHHHVNHNNNNNNSLKINIATSTTSSGSTSEKNDDTTTSTLNTTIGKSTLTRRTDSGLGSSLSRSPSGPYTQRIRHSLMPPPPTTSSSSSLPFCTSSSSSSGDEPMFGDVVVDLATTIDSLNVIEMSTLRRRAFQKLTSILERCVVGKLTIPNPDHDAAGGGGVTSKNIWSVQRLIKRMKIGDGKLHKEHDDVNIFGVGLDVIYQRTGYFLPRPILEVMRFLRNIAPETIGLFRKNGVKSRIAELRTIIDGHSTSSSDDVFTGDTALDATQVHDVADLLKQYFRDLPEPLMTVRMSEVFANICSAVPDVDRLTALQYAVALLPDENREALKTLLLFLKDVSRSSQVNQMSSTNLSVCFTPSLFHLSASRLDREKMTTSTSSGQQTQNERHHHQSHRQRRHKTVGGTTGLPSDREMREAQACQTCLTMLIEYAPTVFMVGADVLSDYDDDVAAAADGVEDDVPNLTDLGLKGPRSFLVDRVIGMIREHSDGWKQWSPEGAYRGIEISSRPPIDSHPLKTFRVWCDVPAAPKSVMMRVLKERHLWDTSTINWRHVEHIAAPDTDIHQYVLNETCGHPTRDCHVARFHTSGLTEIRGACAIAERSVRCDEEHMLGGVTATVLDQRFLIEPSGGGHSRVTYIARVDLKGRSLQWYNKSFGSVMCRHVERLRDSFQLTATDGSGPETNV